MLSHFLRLLVSKATTTLLYSTVPVLKGHDQPVIDSQALSCRVRFRVKEHYIFCRSTVVHFSVQDKNRSMFCVSLEHNYFFTGELIFFQGRAEHILHICHGRAQFVCVRAEQIFSLKGRARSPDTGGTWAPYSLQYETRCRLWSERKYWLLVHAPDAPFPLLKGYNHHVLDRQWSRRHRWWKNSLWCEDGEYPEREHGLLWKTIVKDRVFD